MNSSLSVSIIIPVYNGGDYLKAAIDSALSQDYSNFEVIVVNDGSTDNQVTEDIALSYGNKIRYLKKENGGVASALNIGIREMRGELFSWLSHDDVYEPDKLKRQVAFLQEKSLVGTDFVLYGDYCVINEGGSMIRTVTMPDYPAHEMTYHLLTKTMFHGCSFLVPRKILIEANGFPEHLKNTQDYVLWLKLAEKTPFIHCPGVVLRARMHGSQGSREKKHLEAIREFYSNEVKRLTPASLEAMFPEKPARRQAVRHLVYYLSLLGVGSGTVNGLVERLDIQQNFGFRAKRIVLCVAGAVMRRAKRWVPKAVNTAWQKRIKTT
jgi:glycosyltransferase involved in cell wall biosynthesis